MDQLDENVPHNDVEGGVLIVMEQGVWILWTRIGGVANESIVQTRVARGANVLATQTMPTEAYARLRALFVDPRLCSLGYHGLELESGDVFGQLYAVVRLELLRAIAGPEAVPEQPEELAWRSNPRQDTEVNTMIFLGTRIRLKHKRIFPGEFRAEAHDHFRAILNGSEPFNVVDQLTE
jgi:hypothetical protein